MLLAQSVHLGSPRDHILVERAHRACLQEPATHGLRDDVGAILDDRGVLQDVHRGDCGFLAVLVLRQWLARRGPLVEEEGVDVGARMVGVRGLDPAHTLVPGGLLVSLVGVGGQALEAVPADAVDLDEGGLAHELAVEF
eukprot:15441018-Alexandrium_andersonii.AAC.1